MTMETEGKDVVRLATAATPADAHMLEQALAANGIKSHAVGDYLDAGFGDIPGMRAEVWVHRDDLAAARAILAAHETRRAGAAETEPEA